MVLSDVYVDIIRSIADGLSKGVTDIPNLAPAYEAAKKSLTASNRRSLRLRGQNGGVLLRRLVHLPTGQGALQSGRPTEVQKYSKRALLYKEFYRADTVDPSTYKDSVSMGEQPVGTEPRGLLWGKNSDVSGLMT